MKNIYRILALAAVAGLAAPLSQVSAEPTAATANMADHDMWLTNYEAALAKAKAEKKPVLLDFTGSDWCPPCMAMHKEVLTSAEFEAYAKANLVPVFLDFPRKKQLSEDQKKHNYDLQDKFNIKGYPTYIVLSPEGKELARQVGYLDGGPDAFIAWVKKAAK